MLNRFILATDLSPASFAIANCVGGLHAFGARECLLLQCLSLQEATSTALSYSTAALDRMLDEQQRILESQGFSVTKRIVPGFASTEINRIADEENYPLIVAGPSGQHTLVGETLLGGVASELIHRARKPILLLRIAAQPGQEDSGALTAQCDIGSHILFPTDFSENADHAFQYLEKLVIDGVQRVTLLHVQDQARLDPHLLDRLDEFNAIDQARLDKMKALLETKGTAKITIEVTYGAPFTEISRVVSEQGVRLVLMGSQGRGFIKEVFLGSVSHNVARHSPAAVLLVPAKR